MSKNKEFDPRFHRDLRLVPARGRFFGLPDFGITETFTRLAGKQPTTQIIGQGLGAKTYEIDPEAIQDTLDQATLYNNKGEYVGGILPSGPGTTTTTTEEKKDKPLDLDTGDPTAGVKGQDTKGFLIDFLERDILRRQNERNALRLNQALTNQETAALSERNRQALANQLAFTKFDTAQIAKNQLRAAQREGELMRAIAAQASAGAQIGGLGTGRRFGRG